MGCCLASRNSPGKLPSLQASKSGRLSRKRRWRSQPRRERRCITALRTFLCAHSFWLDPSLWEFHLHLLATISLKLLPNSRRRPSSSSEHVRTCVAGYTCPVCALTHLFQLCYNSPRLSVKCNLNGTRNCLSYNWYYACDDLCLVLTTDRDPHPSHVSGPQQAMGYRVKRVPSSLQV